MNKAELVEKVAETVPNLTKTLADKVLDAITESIMEALANGDKVTLVGFGTFEPTHRAAREGRNPKTGETIQIPAVVRPTFKAGKQFKDLLS